MRGCGIDLFITDHAQSTVNIRVRSSTREVREVR
jgi:hypothetical protein